MTAFGSRGAGGSRKAGRLARRVKTVRCPSRVLPAVALAAAFLAAPFATAPLRAQEAGPPDSELAALLSSADLEGRPALLEAARLEEAGRPIEALRSYLVWLEAHPGSRHGAAVLLHAVRLEPSSREAVRLLQKSLEGPGLAAGSAEREAVVLQTGGLLELLGRRDEARSLYASLAGSAEAALRQAALLLELGEEDEARRVLEPLEGRDHERAALLLARADRLAGRGEAAERRLRGLQLPAALLELFRVLQDRGAGDEARQVLERLESMHPRSPEALLARQAWDGGATPRVLPATSPAELLGGRAPAAAETATREAPPREASAPPETPAAAPAAASPQPAASPPREAPPAGAPSGPDPRLAVIQTGSFTVEENARYMVRDLQRLGYRPRLLERLLDGKRYYRVVLDPPRPPEAAQEDLVKLKSSGYEGFLLFVE